MMKILLTSFEPFGGEQINPSQLICSEIGQMEGAEIVTVTLPVEFGRVGEEISCLLEVHQPDVVVALGQAGGRSQVSLELVGINLRHGLIADNRGLQPEMEPIDPHGAAAYFSTLPLQKIRQEILASDIPCAYSFSAGTYVCNELLYILGKLSAQKNKSFLYGFIHLPYLPQQVAGQKSSAPSMALDLCVQAVKIALQCVIKK